MAARHFHATMLVKCICTNCAGHLEFEEESAGQKIKCPHCGFDTVLYPPGAEKAQAEMASLTRKIEVQRRLLWCVGALVLLGAVLWAIYHWGVPLVAGLMPDTESKVVPVVVLTVVCLSLPFLLAWLVLPVALFLQVRKVIYLLEAIETNLASPPGPASSATSPRADLAATEDSEGT